MLGLLTVTSTGCMASTTSRAADDFCEGSMMTTDRANGATNKPIPSYSDCSRVGAGF